MLSTNVYQYTIRISTKQDSLHKFKKKFPEKFIWDMYVSLGLKRNITSKTLGLKGLRS